MVLKWRFSEASNTIHWLMVISNYTLSFYIHWLNNIRDWNISIMVGTTNSNLFLRRKRILVAENIEDALKLA
jgi:hypothetical protein